MNDQQKQEITPKGDIKDKKMLSQWMAERGRSTERRDKIAAEMHLMTPPEEGDGTDNRGDAHNSKWDPNDAVKFAKKFVQYQAHQTHIDFLNCEIADAQKRGLMEEVKDSKRFEALKDSPFNRFMASDAENLAKIRKEISDVYDEAFNTKSPVGGNGLVLEPQAAFQAGTPASNASLIPVRVAENFVRTIKFYGAARKMVKIITSPTADTYRVGGLDTSGQEGELVAEGSAGSAQDTPNPTNVTYKSYNWSSKIDTMSYHALRDIPAMSETVVTGNLMGRLGRVQNRYFTNGTGVEQPQGLVTGAKDGITTAAGTEFTRQEITGLIYSIDRAYREGVETTNDRLRDPMAQVIMGTMGFMFHDSVEKHLIDLSFSATDQRPLWLPSMVGGLPNTIYGHPYEVNNHMDAMPSVAGAGNDIMLFGNYNYYCVRDVDRMIIQRFDDSKYAEKLEIGFQMWLFGDARYAGAIKNGKCEAVAKLTLASS